MVGKITDGFSSLFAATSRIENALRRYRGTFNSQDILTTFQTIKHYGQANSLFAGRSDEEIADAIIKTIASQFDEAANKGTTLLRPNLSAINVDTVAKHFSERVLPDNVVPIKSGVQISEPKSASFLDKFGRLSASEKLHVGIPALFAGLSLASGVSSALQIYNAKKNAGQEAVEIPTSAYAYTAIQLLLGTGLAVLSHANFKEFTAPTR